MAHGILLDIGTVFKPVRNKFLVSGIRTAIPFTPDNDPFPGILMGASASENQASGLDGIQKLLKKLV
jgi:hypothetical protein